MRRWIGVWVLVLAILGGIAIGVTFFQVGMHAGLTSAANSTVVQVVREPGFFPFGLFLFPLLVFGTIVLVRAVSRRGPWDHHHGLGPWAGHGDRERMAREWHAKLHEEAGAPRDTEGG